MSEYRTPNPASRNTLHGLSELVFRLPRELRDMICSDLWDDPTIQLLNKYEDDRDRKLPTHLIPDILKETNFEIQLAREAVEWLYDNQDMPEIAWSQFRNFLATDYFSVGVTLRERQKHMRMLKVILETMRCYTGRWNPTRCRFGYMWNFDPDDPKEKEIWRMPSSMEKTLYDFAMGTKNNFKLQFIIPNHVNRIMLKYIEAALWYIRPMNYGLQKRGVQTTTIVRINREASFRDPDERF